jgi:hypothetical protein
VYLDLQRNWIRQLSTWLCINLNSCSHASTGNPHGSVLRPDVDYHRWCGFGCSKFGAALAWLSDSAVRCLSPSCCEVTFVVVAGRDDKHFSRLQNLQFALLHHVAKAPLAAG